MKTTHYTGTQKCLITISCILSSAFLLGEAFLLPWLTEYSQTWYIPVDLYYMAFTRPVGLIALAVLFHSLLKKTHSMSKKFALGGGILSALLLATWYGLFILDLLAQPQWSWTGTFLIFTLAQRYSWALACVCIGGVSATFSWRASSKGPIVNDEALR